MKEIKFRARILGWEILQAFALSDIRNVSEGVIFLSSAHELDFDTVQQFTGLKDKNGKEIYEGDIFRFADTYGRGAPHIATVVFEDGAFVDSRFDGRVSERQEREALGNIYENPELMK